MQITAIMILGVVSGAAMLGAGLWLLREPHEGTRLARLGVPTRLSGALVLLVIGYHVGAWTLPDAWVAMKVPLDLWWLVLGAAAAMLISSVAMDRKDQEAGRERDEEAK